MSAPPVEVWAPGRVNLIGDHTDYTGGLALPMAIDLGTTIRGRRLDGRIRLRSDGFDGLLDVPLDVDDPAAVEPAWGRYVAGVAHVLADERGARSLAGVDGEVSTTIPVGTGLSSSVALEVATALALGAGGDRLALAEACQRAEVLASGVPCGLMDQLTSLAGVEGHALLLDFRSLTVVPVPVPDSVEIVVVHSGEERALATSAYGERRAELARAEAEVGSLRDVGEAELDALDDRRVRARARHVVGENRRVRELAAALGDGDLATIGVVLRAGHASFRDDFEASTPAVDELVDALDGVPGVVGARLTGGGFGGCVVAVGEPGALGRHPDAVAGRRSWVVRPSAGARVLS